MRWQRLAVIRRASIKKGNNAAVAWIDEMGIEIRICAAAEKESGERESHC